MGKIMFNGVDYSAPSTAGVTGVKGNAESSYRTGNVNITPANIGALATTDDASNTTTTFTQASTRTNLTTKEKLSISLGKIMKWFADLKTVAFTGSYNDLSNKPTIPSAYTLPSATSTTLGGVKTTDSSAVTNSTGLALAATEKNASIDGTLANQISTLNNNLSQIGATIKTATIRVKDVKCTPTTINPNAPAVFTAVVPNVNGYTPMLISPQSTESVYCYPYAWALSGTTKATLMMFNTSGNALTLSPVLSVLYLRSI